MKKLFVLLLTGALMGCEIGGGNDPVPSNDSTLTSASSSASCGSYKGRSLHKGPQGGCYYINSNGNKTYVDRSYCNC